MPPTIVRNTPAECIAKARERLLSAISLLQNLEAERWPKGWPPATDETLEAISDAEEDVLNAKHAVDMAYAEIAAKIERVD